MRTLILAISAILAFASPQGSTGSIQGKVVRQGTSDPIPGVLVTLTSQGSGTPAPGVNPASMADQISSLIASAPPGISAEVLASAVASLEQRLGGVTGSGSQLTATTDASGNFSFKGLAPGRYTVRAQREGFFGPLLSGTTTYSTIVTSTVIVEAQKPTPDVVLSMVRGSVIAGRVRDPFGLPSSNTSVAAYRVDYRDGRPTLATINSKMTDDRGEYRLFWLPPGEYYVAVTPRRPTAVPGEQDSWVRTFFPGATDARRVAPLIVNDGSELSGIDVNIQVVGSAVKISGVVNNLGAAPSVQPNGIGTTVGGLYAVPDDPAILTDAAFPMYQNVAADRTNGRFEIRGVPPGRYDLIVSMPSGPQNRPFPGRVAIDVGTQDLTGIRIDILPGVDVRARVVFDNPPPTSAVRLQIQAKENYAAPFQSAIVLTAPVPPLPLPGGAVTPPPIPFQTPDGSFLFTNLPQARYAVNVTNVPQNMYVADIRMGGVSIYDTGFVVGREAPQPIDVLVNAGAAKIQGTAQDIQRRPAAGARAVLVPQESRRQNPALYKSASVDDKGNFTMPGVAPGDYKLFVWSAVASTAYMNAEFLAKYETRGQSIHVNAGETLTRDLQLISVESERR